MKATERPQQERNTFEPLDFEDVTMTEMLPATVRAELSSCWWR